MLLLKGTFRCPVARRADNSYSNPCPFQRAPVLDGPRLRWEHALRV